MSFHWLFARKKGRAPAPAALHLAQNPAGTAVAGEVFTQQPQVQLVDGQNFPVARSGVSITASIISGAGTLAGTLTVLTDGNGLATFTDLHIDGATGNRTLQFTATALSGVTPVVAPTVTAVGSGAAYKISIVNPAYASQTGTVSAAIAHAPEVILQDIFDNPVSGKQIVFAKVLGSDAAINPSNGLVTTGVDGKAALTSWTMASAAGTNTVTATYTGVNGSPVLFTASTTSSTTNFAHAQFAITDYWVHYQSAGSQPTLYTFLASKADHCVGGRLDEYKSRNLNCRVLTYNLIWAPIQTTVTAMETWLTANGYPVENAYLHTQGTSVAQANRVAVTIWGSARWLTNPGNQGFQAWKTYQTQQICAVDAAGYRYDALFIDELGSGPMSNIPNVTFEYASRTAYFTDFHTVLTQMRALTPANELELNVAQYWSAAEDHTQIGLAGGGMVEITNGPYQEMENAWTNVLSLMSGGSGPARIHFSSAVQLYRSDVYTATAPATVNAGNYATIEARVLIWLYASYLTILDGAHMDRLLFNPWGIFTVNPTTHWITANEYAIGAPTGARSVLQSGTDGAGQTYTVWQRDFDNALVYIRPKKSYAHTQYGDSTAVTLNLPAGNWKLLAADGTLGSLITTIDLRAAEAAILIKS